MPKTGTGQTAIGALLLLAALLLAIWLVFSFSIERLAIAFSCLLLGMLLLFWKSGNELKDRLEEKRKIDGMVKEAEQKFLRREMSEEAFRDFSLQKQKELIGIGSKIAGLKEKEGADSQEEMQRIASRKKHVLKELLQQKKAVESELQISEQKYLNRELEEKAFFEVQRNAQSRLLELDSEIRNLYVGENIDSVLDEMQQKLREAEPIRRKKRRTETESDVEEMASDLSDQSGKKSRN